MLTHLVFAGSDTGCLTGRPSVQVLTHCGFVGHVKRQNEAPWVRPAQAVVDLGRGQQRKNAVSPHFRHFCSSKMRAVQFKFLCEAHLV